MCVCSCVTESAHEPATTKDRAAALFHSARPRHSCHVAGLVGDPGDSSYPGPADWLCRGLVCRRRGLFHLSSPASQLVMAISCRSIRLGEHLRSGLVSPGSSLPPSQRGLRSMPCARRSPTATPTDHIWRAGINYRFDAVLAPPPARIVPLAKGRWGLVDMPTTLAETNYVP
jgi:hypothetical protein